MSNSYFWFSIFILLNTTLLFLLTANVSRLRLKLRISVGDGGSSEMVSAIRAQCNGVEQVPSFALIVLALTFLHTSGLILAILVIAFTIARVFHAYGMLFKSPLNRRIGAFITYFFQFFGIVVLAYQILV